MSKLDAQNVMLSIFSREKQNRLTYGPEHLLSFDIIDMKFTLSKKDLNIFAFDLIANDLALI